MVERQYRIERSINMLELHGGHGISKRVAAYVRGCGVSFVWLILWVGVGLSAAISVLPGHDCKYF